MKQQPESICWRCKNNGCYGVYPEQYDCGKHCACQWVENGTPIPNWDAEDGLVIEGIDPYGVPYRYQSYYIKGCPQFEMGFEYSNVYEILDLITESVGVSYTTVHSHPIKYAKVYENMFKTRLPQWFYDEIEAMKEERLAKQQAAQQA